AVPVLNHVIPGDGDRLGRRVEGVPHAIRALRGAARAGRARAEAGVDVRPPRLHVEVAELEPPFVERQYGSRRAVDHQLAADGGEEVRRNVDVAVRLAGVERIAAEPGRPAERVDQLPIERTE